MVERGLLPAIRLGHRTVRFRWIDVEKTLRDLTINPKSLERKSPYTQV